MILLIILYSLIGSVALASSAIVDKEGYEIMYDEEIKNSLKKEIIVRSIETMRNNGMDDEAIKKKMMESFSLDEETIDRLLE